MASKTVWSRASLCARLVKNTCRLQIGGGLRVRRLALFQGVQLALDVFDVLLLLPG